MTNCILNETLITEKGLGKILGYLRHLLQKMCINFSFLIKKKKVYIFSNLQTEVAFNVCKLSAIVEKRRKTIKLLFLFHN